MENNNTDKLIELMFKTFRLMKGEMCYTNRLTHLSVLQIHTLIFLRHNEKVTMSKIAEYFDIELSSATSLLNKLCDQELVERHGDKEDRRLVIVALTEKGKILLKQVMGQRKEKIEKVLLNLSKKERDELYNILKVLNLRLQKIK